MSAPFQLVWTDEFNVPLSAESFAISFPGNVSEARQIQVQSNAAALQTFETLINVKFFLTGDPNDVNIVQNIWPNLGGITNPQLNGGVDISFNFGQSFIRFDSTHGSEADPTTWIPLPVEAVGSQGAAETLGAFDTAHMIVRYVIPPGATQFKKLKVRLSLGFDII